jgi:membrane protein required for colicin V production
MNILDIIILICMTAALIEGLVKGFISQAISVISLLVGIWASSRFAGMVCEWLSQYISGSEQTLHIVAFAIIFIVVILILGLVGKMLEKIISFVMLGWLNRLLGAALALVKCMLILALLATAFNAMNEALHLVNPDTFAESQLYPTVRNFADIVFPYLKTLLIA